LQTNAWGKPESIYDYYRTFSFKANALLTTCRADTSGYRISFFKLQTNPVDVLYHKMAYFNIGYNSNMVSAELSNDGETGYLFTHAYPYLTLTTFSGFDTATLTLSIKYLYSGYFDFWYMSTEMT